MALVLLFGELRYGVIVGIHFGIVGVGGIGVQDIGGDIGVGDVPSGLYHFGSSQS